MGTAGTDPFVTLIAGLEDVAPSTEFYGQLCEAICASAGLERAVIFHYDPDLRSVRPLGAHGIELSVFGQVYVSPDTASFVRDALEQDEVVAIDGPSLAARTPDAFRPLAEGRRVVCVPMISSGKWVGLMLADRPDSAPALTPDECLLLRALGKAVALATMARRATRKDEDMRMLRGRMDLAREVHDGVVQRLFGVSLALEGTGPLGAEDRARCAAEVHAAMSELRGVVGGRGTKPRAAPGATLLEELSRWSTAHPDVDLNVVGEVADGVPDPAAPLVHAVLAEALRNAKKHATPRTIDVTLWHVDGALEFVVRNDGLGAGGAAPDLAGAGIGLRLLGIEALQSGGVLEFGARGDDAWQIRLVLPESDV